MSDAIARRALSFGTDAKTYDAARPGYPQALYDDLLARTGSAPSVLDVGAGTGKASIALAERGAEVLALEPDARMAAVLTARAVQRITCEVTSFEEWAPNGSFDLVVSAQAWHWVDPDIGVRTARQVLRDDGYLAVWWNVPRRQDMEAMDRFDVVYEHLAPELRETSVVVRTMDEGRHTEAIRHWSLFDEPEVTTYNWTRRYTSAEYVQLLTTHSDHRLLPDDRRAALLDGIATAIDEMGGELVYAYETRLTVCRVASS